MSERNIITATQVKVLVKGHELNLSGDFVEALEQSVRAQVAKAAARAKANKRKTLRVEDL